MSRKAYYVTVAATADLDDIAVFYAAYSPKYALKLGRLLLECFRRVGRQPKAGTDRGHFAPGLRSVVVDRKYLVFFRRVGRTTHIIHVMNGVRNITASTFAP